MGVDIADYNNPQGECDGKTAWVKNQQYFTHRVEIPVFPSTLFNGVHSEASGAAHAWIPDWDMDALRSQLVETYYAPTDTTPPAHPNDYARYLVPVGATGAWFGKGNHLALAVADSTTNSHRWVFRPPSSGLLGFDITDIDPANHFWSIYNEDLGSWVPFLQHALNSPLHTDVLISGLADGDVLTYDSVSAKWKNVPPSLVPHGLHDHTDDYWSFPVGPGSENYVVTWQANAGGSGVPGFVLSQVDLSDTTGSLDLSTRTTGNLAVNRIAPGNVGDVLTTAAGPTVVWAPPSGGGGGGGSGMTLLAGTGVTYADNVVGSFVRKDTTTPQIRWDYPSGVGIMQATSGFGFGNLVIPSSPSGITHAMFYARLNRQHEVGGLIGILRNFQLAAVRKNASSNTWDFIPDGLMGNGSDLVLDPLTWPVSSADGPWLNRINYLEVPGVFYSALIPVTAGEKWALSAAFEDNVDRAGAASTPAPTDNWTVSGGPGNGNLMTYGGNPYTLFGEWGVLLYG